MATKAELETQLKSLKDKLKTANRAIKDLTAKQIDDTMVLESLPNTGIALINSLTEKIKVVTLRFDPVSGNAQVEDIENFDQGKIHMAVLKVNKELSEMIQNKGDK